MKSRRGGGVEFDTWEERKVLCENKTNETGEMKKYLITAGLVSHAGAFRGQWGRDQKD